MTVSLGNHVDLLTGFPFKSACYTDRPDDVLVLRGDNVGQGRLRWDGAKRWPRKELNQYAQFELRPGDVILAMDRPWIEAGLKWAWIRPNDDKPLLVQRVARMRGINGLLTEYLRYLIGSPAFTNHVSSITTGVNVPHISARDIKAFQFELPPLGVQRRIAGILSAYDDLIEVNTRRIDILEEMARRLFDEWFVRFRFPGYLATKLHRTSFGTIPEGWQRRDIGDTWEVIGGGTPSKENPKYWEGGEINWYTPTDLTRTRTSFIDGSLQKITDCGLAESSARLFPAYSIMMTSRATLGVIAINTTPATTNQGFITCIPNEDAPLFFLYFWLNSNAAEFERHASGATFKEITKGTFKKLPIMLPPRDLVRRFEATIDPLMQQSRTLQASTRNLRAVRDLLLPKLISGEIDLSGVERQAKRVVKHAAAE